VHAETTIETRKQEGNEQAWRAQLRRAELGAEDQLAARRRTPHDPRDGRDGRDERDERDGGEAKHARPWSRHFAAKPDEPGDDGGLI
jgi:hypothetical protein